MLQVRGNSKFDNEFANKPSEVKAEFFKMIHEIITSPDPTKLSFVRPLYQANSFYFTTANEKYAVTFELQFFNIIQFMTCDKVS